MLFFDCRNGALQQHDPVNGILQRERLEDARDDKLSRRRICCHFYYEARRGGKRSRRCV